MGERAGNKIDIYDRCEALADRVLQLTDGVVLDFRSRPLVGQLVRSATSIAANMMEASEAQSDKDFIHKLSIALKEAKETLYWLRILKVRKSVDLLALDGVFTEGQEIVKILATIKNKMIAKVSAS
ncbi:MAG: four helix bundle protein [Patescibacteria group bacterium]|jgi:four helix bundle protein